MRGSKNLTRRTNLPCLLAYADQTPIADIARLANTTRMTVYKCLDKALTMGWEA